MNLGRFVFGPRSFLTLSGDVRNLREERGRATWGTLLNVGSTSVRIAVESGGPIRELDQLSLIGRPSILYRGQVKGLAYAVGTDTRIHIAGRRSRVRHMILFAMMSATIFVVDGSVEAWSYFNFCSALLAAAALFYAAEWYEGVIAKRRLARLRSRAADKK